MRTIVLVALVLSASAVATAAPIVRGMYVGPPGYDHGMAATRYCGNAPSSWVRGNVSLSAAGVLHVDAELETDDTTAGPKGRIDVILLDKHDAVLATVESSVVQHRGKYPGKSAKDLFGANTELPGGLTDQVAVLEIDAECVGVLHQAWWDPTPIPNVFTLQVVVNRQPSLAWKLTSGFLLGLGGHLLLWLTLLGTIYPRSAKFRRVLMFTPFWRNVLGAFYTQILIVLIAPLRRWLFRPLTLTAATKDPLEFDEASFYPRLRVSRLHPANNPQLPATREPARPWDTLYECDGLVELQGASGLGKTSILKALAARAQSDERTWLFLRASDCSQGVVQRIVDDLHLQESGKFVERMIEDGAIDLFIDALNEASPTTIAAIALFCSENRRRGGRIVIATQPNVWSCPAHAVRFELQELESSELVDFLASQWTAVGRPESEKEAYLARARAFVESEKHSFDREMLRNPMDLALVALLLAEEKEPDVHALRDQVIGDAAAEYERSTPGALFPFAALATAAIRVLETGHPILDFSGTQIDPSALAVLADRKLLLRRGDNTYMLRHVTITAYFVARSVQSEVPDELLTPERCNNPQFRDVYRRLAEALPFEAVTQMIETLRVRGRKSHDRTLEIEIQDIVDTRRARSPRK